MKGKLLVHCKACVCIEMMSMSVLQTRKQSLMCRRTADG